ncbi:hypothetical protein DSO57_1029546 [Entomophthora muscae]|uniref:Uncharacterized protein n=1 Tax=Entomophthora muscae TaxID=34485 RepID=A0ACC2SQB7_9FUNG|nr:hypothetical protein DSO57_1029546 [Entomophthora muscae]
MVNSSGRTKHCHFCSPEQEKPGSATLKTLSQDPCPASALSANLNPAKIKETKTHVLLIFHLNSSQVDHQATAPYGDQPSDPPQALYCPPGAPIGPVHFTKYPPNPAYVEYNLETILIANPLARTRETEYIGHEGKRIEVLPLLFKDKYNYLPAYFVSMTPPLTPQPERPMKTPNAAETMSTQLFGVLYITLTGMVDTMVPNSGPWSFLGQSISYIIKLAPILWWTLPSGLAIFCPEPTNASNYAWLPERKRHDTSCAMKNPWENSTALHNHKASLMTLIAALDNELWLLKVWLPAKLPNQCKMSKICNQGTRIDFNINLSINHQSLDRIERPNMHFEAKYQEKLI